MGDVSDTHLREGVPGYARMQDIHCWLVVTVDQDIFPFDTLFPQFHCFPQYKQLKLVDMFTSLDERLAEIKMEIFTIKITPTPK